ncbi:alpha/beta hydrolase [Soonwooa sp.]|uniref:alpha/beta fold hydrolase n=1 Tax=Soonwooa sp. TaxID=1938592 RepID=UPI00261A51D8|nr:alpha/beta hydrolase [Soonwooa sp.]
MLHYEISGKGRETLVLLHGFMENLEIWNDMIPHLSEDFQLVKVDLAGFGKSAPIADAQTMDLMAEEVKKLTDYLEVESFHLLGHSMGGYISLAFAEKYPQLLKSFTLFFSTYFEDDDEKKNVRLKSLRVIKDNYKAYANAGIPNLFGPDAKHNKKDKIELAKQIAYTANIDGVLACQKGMIERPDRKSVLENFNGKMLLLAGRFDNAVNSIKTISELPDRENISAYLLNCGHNGHWEKPSICAEIINTELLDEE